MQTQADNWQRNLKALEGVDPALARRLATHVLPDGVRPARGRDGTATWRIRQQDGREEWFGRTSMPTVSAEGLLGQFAAGTGNVLLPGIGSGLEAKLLSERLGRHRAAVVTETQALHVALALRMWDVAAALANRQIVLLVDEDPAALRCRLQAFCERYPGFEIPTKMLAWPWRTKAENAAWQGLVEEVAMAVRRQRATRLAEVEAQLRAAPAEAMAEGVAAITTTPGVIAARLTQWLAEGAEAAGMRAVSCSPESPLHAGPLAGLEAATELAKAGGKVQLLLVDQLRSGTKGDVNCVAWLARPDALAEGWEQALGPADWIVTASPRHRRQVERAGLTGRHSHVPAFVSPRAFQLPDVDRTCEVVVLSDLPAEDPDQAGVTLHSHRVLWEALRMRLHDEVDAYRPVEAGRWLAAAQTRTRIEMTEPAVVEQFTEAIQMGLAPAVVMSLATKAIVDAGLPVRIHGRGWERVDWAKAAWAGPADDPQERVEILRRARTAVLGQCRPGTAWLTAEAAAAGAAIMARDLWPDAALAELFEPGREMAVWVNRRELVERLRHLLRDESARAAMVERARRRALRDHAADVRLRQVLRAACCGAQ